MKTFRALHARFADFDLRLIHDPSSGLDYPYTLIAMNGRANPRIDKFINLIAVENYLNHEENQSGVPHANLEEDDGMVTININGTDIMLPAGSSVEDALIAYDERDNIGTINVNPEEAAYILMLQEECLRNGQRLTIDTGNDHPFTLRNAMNIDSFFLNSSGVHKFLRSFAPNPVENTNETDRPARIVR